jgi:hypothetical protein
MPWKTAGLSALFAQAFRAETLSMRHYGRITKKVSVCPLRGQQHRVSGRGALRGWRRALAQSGRTQSV